MRDYLVISIILVSLPIGIIRPYYGILVYAWVTYMYPQMLAWSFAQTFPVAKLAALSACAGIVINLAADLAPLPKRENIVMVLLWCMFTFSSVFAVYQREAWKQWQDVSKLILMSLLTSTMLTDRKKVRYFLLVVALSIGFYGIKGGIFSIRLGGNGMVVGPGTSVIGANNSIGLALNMCLPMLWYLAVEERGFIRRALQIAFFLSIPAIMFTYSRASAVTLAVVLLALILKGRNAVTLLAILLIAALIAVPLIPQIWWDRQNTTLSYEADGSAMSRIENWKFLWRVALDNPLVGVGFQFGTRAMFAKYAPEFLETFGRGLNTHNIFMAMLASHGFPGLLIFLAMIGFALLSCRKIRRSVRHRPDLKWLGSYCDLVQVSMLAFLVNGMFVNMEYFDLPYHLVALTASMKVICHRLLTEDPVEIPATSRLAAAV